MDIETLEVFCKLNFNKLFHVNGRIYRLVGAAVDEFDNLYYVANYKNDLDGRFHDFAVFSVFIEHLSGDSDMFFEDECDIPKATRFELQPVWWHEYSEAENEDRL
jgi:hypothetical protein